MLTVLVTALIVGLLVVALVAARRWRTRAASQEPSTAPVVAVIEDVAPVPAWTTALRGPPLPVVLVHGLFGFDQIGVPGARFDYFRGRIDLIAHSLGGLDARYALAHLGLARRVRSLVTVGTPHRGTPIADLALRGPLDWARRIVQALGLPLEAIEWLGTDALAAFNAQVLDVPGVRYACVVGGMHRDDSIVPLALAPAHAYLRRVAGPNDGLVPVASQYWGETLAEIEADHFAQIGWRVAVRGTFDAPSLYAFVVARLGDVATPSAAAISPRLADGRPS